MNGHWPTTPFESLFLVPQRNGLTRPKKVRGRGVHFVNMGELFAYRRLGNIPMDRVPMNESERSKFLLGPGDLLFARQSLTLAGAGQCSIVLSADEPRTFESHLIRVRLDRDRAVPSFYFYLFWSRPGRILIESIVEQVAAAGIRGSDLRRLLVPMPPLDEQRRIATVLGALDDKIELNRKMNRTLEEMAQSIFKSWFIDFDGVPESEMVESKLGQIPSGWALKPVNEIVRFNPRTKLAKGTLAKFVEMKALPTAGCSVEGVVKKAMKSGGAKFIQGDTLLARITPSLENGKTALVDFLDPGEVGFGSTEFIVMRPSGRFSREWVYCLARSDEFRQHAIANMTGSSGRQRVPVDCFSHFEMPEPPTNVLAQFRDATAVLFHRIKANSAERRTLAELRDALLPKLISGEIRVPEAEATVEDVL